MDNKIGVCDHPKSQRLQIEWYVQLCRICGERISCNVPAYPKDTETGKTLMRQRFLSQKGGDAAWQLVGKAPTRTGNMAGGRQ